MKVLLLVVLFLLSSTSFAEGFKSEDAVRKYTDTLIKMMMQEDFQKAIDSAKPHWPIPEVEVDGLVNAINQQWPAVKQRFGSSVSSELVKTERIGKSFIRYYYLHKFEKHAIYWKVDFYKARSTWLINKISYADDLNLLYH